MKLNILRFYTSLLFISISFIGIAQDKDLEFLTEVPTDTIKASVPHGLRLGVDISKPIIGIFNEDISGIEITGDYRITNKIYAAAELGIYDRKSEEYNLKHSTKGSYIKVGGNINLYENWLGMNNEIFFGLRYGLSSFTQTLNSYTPNYNGTYFEPEEISVNQEFDGLTAHWTELVIGLKVELLKNFYLGSSMSLKKIISQNEPENFKNLFIPGFERVYANNTGFSFNYTISYLIPIYKKNK
ncbi:DUF6048 family protein [Urechidicola croceus]|uniref:Outer membrane protein beta-barrel domain-containing protein n=1 Tax=Urechidicola croceus TaxID=1850246 RepID=A0A1D8P625_9FLAO|nr:DUF6048 family protein [Urechidicola croceus]AOW20015.1 hypothetical protein LPB138_04655 [Urechidicola croceus]